MIIKRMLTFSACLVILLLLQGCTGISTPSISDTRFASMQAADLQTLYSGLAGTGGRVYKLNPSLSIIRIYAFRGGRAPSLGHNHVLSAPTFSGYVFLPDSSLADARFDLTFRLDELQLDDPANRAALGKTFSTVIPPDAIMRTRNHMLGEDNLQAAEFPVMRIHSIQIAGELPKLAAKLSVELHGEERTFWVPLSVAALPDKLTVSGALVLLQSDFGIHPYSVLGGFLAVQDPLVIEFTLTGK